MGLDQVIDQADDVVQGELGGGVRLQHGGMIDVLALFRRGGLNGEQMYIDMRLVHGRELYGQPAHITRGYAGAVHQTGHLHAGLTGKIFNQPACVEHVAAQLIGAARNHSLDNA